MRTSYKLRSRSAALGAAGLLALAAAGCGGDDEEQATRGLVQDKADRLTDLLDQAEEQFDVGECDALSDTVSELETEVSDISDPVDEDLRSTLSDEVGELDGFTGECEQPEEETTEEETTAPPPTVPETTEEETTEEETEEETTEEEEPEPPQDGGGNDEPPVPDQDNGVPPDPPGQDGQAPPGQSGELPDDGSSEPSEPQEADASAGGRT